MPPRPLALVSLLSLLAFAGCGNGSQSPEGDTAPRELNMPPEHILIDHILIGVRSQEFMQGKRTVSEARQFTYDLLEKLRAGSDWTAAKNANSEDGQPGMPGGPYRLANNGVQPSPGEVPRRQMVPAFGDVGFSLAVGQIGVAEYDKARSPYGFHIIKRVE